MRPPDLDTLFSFAVEADRHFRATHRGRTSKRCEACKVWAAMTSTQARQIRKVLEQSIEKGMHRYCVLCSRPRERKRRLQEAAHWLVRERTRKERKR